MDNLVDWFYGQVVGFLGNFFAEMGNMGVELFELDWVSAIVLFFSQLGWADAPLWIRPAAWSFPLSPQRQIVGVDGYRINRPGVPVENCQRYSVIIASAFACLVFTLTAPNYIWGIIGI